MLAILVLIGGGSLVTNLETFPLLHDEAIASTSRNRTLPLTLLLVAGAVG